MSVANFVPSVWAAAIRRDLRAAQVFAQPGVINRNYEGEIAAAGDRVNINSIGDVTIVNYTPNADLPAPEELTDEQRTLIIDQAKAFNFQVDNVDRRQARGNVLGEGIEIASIQLAETADAFVAGLHTGIDAGNAIGTGIAPETPTTGDDAYNLLVDLGTLLSEANVPALGRWAAVPPWYEALLRKAGQVVEADPKRVLNGQSGQTAGFRLLPTTVIPQDTGNDVVVVGTSLACTFADQINDVIAYEPELRFADAVKGLHLYGAKLVEPTGWAKATCTRPA